jgi:hypothetical protein
MVRAPSRGSDCRCTASLLASDEFSVQGILHAFDQRHLVERLVIKAGVCGSSSRAMAPAGDVM